ncbi:MAG: FG-GAP repeat protein [Planctomycetes bacterium]|nr:FG-GAP repeat protein [Planctomycetota bacterium]
MISSASLAFGQVTTCPQQQFDNIGLRYRPAFDTQGDLLVYGAPWEFCAPDSVQGCGAVYVFRYDGAQWRQVTRLRPDDLYPYNAFGFSVAIDGDLIVVGAPAYYCPGFDPTGPGSVYVYRQVDPDNWNLEAKISAPFPSEYDAFGHSVDVKNGYVVVGSPGRTNCALPNTEPRTVYGYVLFDGVWIAESILSRPSISGFGTTVRLSEPHLAIGCGTDTGNGGTHVFKRNGTNWTETANIPNSQASSVIDLDGDRLLVCATTYRFNGTTWAFEANLRRPNGNYFCNGYGVSLRGDRAVSDYDFVFEFQFGAWKPTIRPSGIPTENFFVATELTDQGLFIGPYFFDLNTEDCNSNNVDDRCESLPPTDCNHNGALDICDIFSGSSTDCNDNGVPDECETLPDCNHNSSPDVCDIVNGSSTDCDDDQVPDECQPFLDCNANGVRDACDIKSGASNDCNGNHAPDECDLANGLISDCDGNGLPDPCTPETDCNGNGVFDACDLVNGTSLDCDGNGIPDDCEQDTLDCNSNGVPDRCDIAAGTLTDANGDGFADECGFGFGFTLQPAPDDAQGPRYISFVVPYVQNAPPTVAIRVRLASLVHPNPPNAAGITGPSFAGFEDRVRWVASPVYFTESNAPPAWGYVSQLSCAPYYTVWNGGPGGRVVYVSGPEILPSSDYDVQLVAQSCQGAERNCANVSAPLRVHTRRWGDVTPPFQAASPAPITQPDIMDVAAIINKLKDVPGALVVSRTDLFGSAPNHRVDISDVSSAVDAFKGLAFPFAGPSNCP